MKFYAITAMVLLLNFYSSAQSTLIGSITDEQQQPLVGANVRTADNQHATSTDESGEFLLSGIEPGDYELVISYVGFVNQTVQITMPTETELKIVLVEATFLADKVIVSATRASENMPLTYSEVDKEVLEENNMGKDLPYLLELTPSVVTTSDAGAGVGYTGVRIRGSDATRVNVTLNGIPYNDSESQQVYWVNLPDMASSVESIQVQRGVGTSTNGPGAFGGSINIQTTGLNEKAYATLDNAFGSFNTRKHTLNLGTGLINGAFSIDGRLSNIISDGYIDRATSDLTSYYLSAGYYDKKNMLKFNMFSGHEVTYQAWYGTPESRINNDTQGMIDYINRNGLSPEEADNLLTSGRTYNYYTYDNQVDDYQQNHFQLIYVTDFSDYVTWNTALHYTHGEGYYEQYEADQNLADYGYQGGVTDLIRRRWLKNDFYGLTFSLDYNPSSKLNFILGGAWNKYDGDHYGEIIWAQNAGNSHIRDQYYDNNGTKYDFTTYGKLSMTLAKHVGLFADLQYRHVDYSISGVDNDGTLLNEMHDYDFFNPKLGLTYQLADNSNLYASFSVGNKEPNRVDFVDAPDNETPKAETLRNLEIGFKQTKAAYTIEANYYLMDYKNQLVLTGELNDVGSPIRTNVDRSTRMGIELVAGMALSNKFSLNINATFSNNVIKDFQEVIYDYGQNYDEYNAVIIDYGQTSISFSPNVIAGGSLVFKPIKGMAVNWNHRYVSDQYLDNTNTESRKIDAYYLSDIISSYSFSALKMKSIGLKFAVYNLFNTTYESNGYTFGYRGGGEEVRENFFYPQAGINFMAGLTLKL